MLEKTEQKEFLNKECEYLRDELKLQVQETNSLAKNAIIFTAAIISLICLKEGMILKASSKYFLSWLPFILNGLMTSRVYVIGLHTIRISNYIREYEQEIFGPEIPSRKYGWEYTMKIWRDHSYLGVFTNQTLTWFFYWACIVIFSFFLPWMVSENSKDNDNESRTEQFNIYNYNQAPH